MPAAHSTLRPQHSRWRKLFAAFAVLLSGMLLAAGSDTRFQTLGHKMICGCGCNQILLDCNHVGCPLSDGMRNELAAALGRGDSDDLVLQAFVQKYGPTILAAPTATGFNRVAWITPFAVLLAGLLIAIFFVRRWGARPLVPSANPAEEENAGRFHDQIRRETEL